MVRRLGAQRRWHRPEEEEAQRTLEPHGVDVVEEHQAEPRPEQDGREEDADELCAWLVFFGG